MCSFAEGDKGNEAFVDALGLKESPAAASAGLPAGYKSYTADLTAMSPDPQKKLKD